MMTTKKVDYFVIPNDPTRIKKGTKFDLVNDGLMDRGLTAEDVISINYDPDLQSYVVWYKTIAID